MIDAPEPERETELHFIVLGSLEPEENQTLGSVFRHKLTGSKDLKLKHSSTLVFIMFKQSRGLQ